MNGQKAREYLQHLEDFFQEDIEALKSLEILKRKLSHIKIDKKLQLQHELEHETFQKSDPLMFPLSPLIKDEWHFALYSDGACRGNPGVGAWGGLGQKANGEIISQISGLDVMTTNNRMELMGAISVIKQLKDYLKSCDEKNHKNDKNDKNDKNYKVYVFSDSRYVVDGVEKWLKGWKKRGWRKSDGLPPENLEYWKLMDQTLELFPHIYFIWVKGHSGHPQNEKCDELANRAIDEALS